MLTPPSAGPGPGSARRPRYQRRHIRSFIQRVSSKLVSLWQTGSITPLLSREIVDEYLRVLSYAKFQLSEEELKELIQEEILPFAEVIKPKRRLRVVRRDPSDTQFLECAVAGKASVIISDDKDLLSLGRFRRIRIQSPAQFLADHPGLRES
jgi:putative PIN family toxin of toxin-antitoxin system